MRLEGLLVKIALENRLAAYAFHASAARHAVGGALAK
jgi:hypothetical protein